MSNAPTIPTYVSLHSQRPLAEAAHWLADFLNHQLQTHTSGILAVSGGSSVTWYKEAFALLPAAQKCTGWKLTLADERFGIPHHADSNETSLRSSGVIQDWKNRGGEWWGWLRSETETLGTAAQRLSDQWRTMTATHATTLLLLGMGDDGHTLSWLPVATQAEFETLYNPPHQLVTSLDVTKTTAVNQFTRRLTLTVSAVAQASSVVLFALGERKGSALSHFMAAEGEVHRYPVRQLRYEPAPLTVLSDVLEPT